MPGIVAERDVATASWWLLNIDAFSTADTTSYWELEAVDADVLDPSEHFLVMATIHLKHTVANAQCAIDLAIHEGLDASDPRVSVAFPGPIRLPPVALDVMAFTLVGMMPVTLVPGDPLPGHRRISLNIRNLTAGTLSVLANADVEGSSQWAGVSMGRVA